jgi:hypothetical protein
MTTFTAPATIAGPRFRAAALAAGPTALLALALTIAMIATGDSNAEIAGSPLAVASAVTGLASLILLAIALVGLLNRVDRLRSGAGLVGWVLALTGTIMTAGGQWELVFLLPGLSAAAPEIANSGLSSVTAGYMISFVLLGVGWITVAVMLLRAGVARGAAWAILVGGLLCIAPLPVRWFLIATGVTIMSLRASASYSSAP